MEARLLDATVYSFFSFSLTSLRLGLLPWYQRKTERQERQAIRPDTCLVIIIFILLFILPIISIYVGFYFDYLLIINVIFFPAPICT